MKNYRGLLGLFILFAIVNLAATALVSYELYTPLTGRDITTNIASIGIFIFSNFTDLGLEIHTPINGTTYNFNIGSNYTLDLNVSSTLEVDRWYYELYDIRHDSIIYSEYNFTPNTTINAVRWGNRLTVYGRSGSLMDSRQVYFDISVPNSPPEIGNLPSNFLVCEGNSFIHTFNVSDPDEGSLSVFVSPTNPFFIFPNSFYGESYIEPNIVSAVLSKQQVGNHSLTVATSDGQYSDSVDFSIYVIEINNAPSVSNPGVQTIWNNGPDSTFYYQINTLDDEDGNSSDGNLTFNLDFINSTSFFNITNHTGIINFTANSSYLGVFNLSVCVIDKGITNVHQNISLCNQDGSPLETCTNFSLTITNDNRYPNITIWSPVNLSLDVTGGNKILFNITKYDPDGTIPDSYWYFDTSKIAYFTGSINDSLEYTIPCGMNGIHNLTVTVTDGLLNKSLIWSLNVTAIICPASSSSGGSSSSSGGGFFCNQRVVCEPWNTCTNLENVFRLELISNKDYIGFKNSCLSLGFEENTCGYQIRNCMDLNYCNYTFINESEAQFCEYSENPSCDDGIKNCHDGDCEILVDCGGSCNACSTCSDQIRNQGENGIDCGGPCPTQCPVRPPIIEKEELKNILYIIISIILMVLIVLIVLRIIKIIRIKKELGELRWYALFRRRPEQQ